MFAVHLVRHPRWCWDILTKLRRNWNNLDNLTKLWEHLIWNNAFVLLNYRGGVARG